MVAAFIADAKPIAKRIATERDKLRDVLEEYREMLSSVEQAADDFEGVIDTLSQYV